MEKKHCYQRSTIFVIVAVTCGVFFVVLTQDRNQLGTPGGAKCFLIGAQILETRLCPILLNYVQHIFLGGSLGEALPPFRPRS